MRISLFMLVLMFAFNAAGCKLLQVKGEVGEVEIDAKTKEEAAKDDGSFCPPGQAKKGRC